MPKYDILVPTRDEWQKARDGAKVPKGATKVSIGDSIAAVHKSFKPESLAKNVQDSITLIKNLDTYMAQTKAKYPAFEATVKKFRKKADDHKAVISQIIDAEMQYPAKYKSMLETYQLVKANKLKADKLAGKIEEIRGCVAAFSMVDPKWMAKQQLILQWHKHCGSVDTLTDKDKTGIEAMFADIKP